MSSHLLIIAIGPVQDFIAAARKIRDLWFGSYLLSELSKHVARTVVDQGGQLIFPFPSDLQGTLMEGSELNAPNKILALLHGQDPRTVFDTMKKSLEAYWRKMPDRLLPSHVIPWIDPSLFGQQLEDFLEIYGVWTPCDGAYPAAWREVESLLAARKTLRQFPPWIVPEQPKGAPPKSSLDGKRESILTAKAREQDRGRLQLKDFEELDAVGFVKRHGAKLQGPEISGFRRERPKFDTLSDLAADPWLRGVEPLPDAQGQLGKLCQLIEKYKLSDDIPTVASRPDGHPLKDYGAQVLFPTRMYDLVDALKETDAVKKEIKRRFEEVYTALRKLAKSEPCPYAAVIVGDGDHMGKALGHVLKGNTSPQAHQNVSEALDKFAHQAPRILEDHKGSLIYSGGDDVLAFCPLDTLLVCLDSLRATFGTGMESVIAPPDTPTFSMGVAIVHHLRPMGLSLEAARTAERYAKQTRNALAISLEKRSGPPLSIRGDWGSGVIERLQYWTQRHCADELPDKFGYQLRRLAMQWDDDTLVWKDGQPDNVITFEMLRILNRKRSGHGARAMPEEVLAAICQHAQKESCLGALADELILTRLLAQAASQAAAHKEVS